MSKEIHGVYVIGQVLCIILFNNWEYYIYEFIMNFNTLYNCELT